MPFDCDDKLFDFSHWSWLWGKPRGVHCQVIRHSESQRVSYVKGCDERYYIRVNEDNGNSRAGSLIRIHEIEVFGPEKL